MSAPSPSDHVFVYGTLRSDSGHTMSTFLAQRATLIGRGSVAGRLIQLPGYPAAVEPEHAGQRITGEVYRLGADEAALLAELDEYEGCDAQPPLFTRRAAEVQMESGERVSAWIWMWGR